MLYVAWLLAACAAPRVEVDGDADGYESADDCDDADPDIHPDQPEVCDGVDQDCDGQVDEAPLDGAVYYRDADGDGFGNALLGIRACTPPDGYVADATDCDDTDPDIHPSTEPDSTSADSNCDGVRTRF